MLIISLLHGAHRQTTGTRTSKVQTTPNRWRTEATLTPEWNKITQNILDCVIWWQKRAPVRVTFGELGAEHDTPIIAFKQYAISFHCNHSSLSLSQAFYLLHTILLWTCKIGFDSAYIGWRAFLSTLSFGRLCVSGFYCTRGEWYRFCGYVYVPSPTSLSHPHSRAWSLYLMRKRTFHRSFKISFIIILCVRVRSPVCPHLEHRSAHNCS